MPLTSVHSVVDALRQQRLLDAAQLAEVETSWQERCPEPRSLARELLDRGWLTTFQINQLLAGKANLLSLGSYILLDRLGHGATGEVFRARHRTMNRVVALKVLRKELHADRDVMARFSREIEVASQLTHPNIVHALDAGPIGNHLVLALEYVEGVDLSRLVKESGPLAVDQACDYARQAALGLQHAHECGLIHRDVKPSNLLVARSAKTNSWSDDSEAGPRTRGYGVVKLLDLGLARLSEPPAASATRNLTVLAGNSMLMGTPDYMAPEQALDFHGADVRSDVYSLGCTLYFLLAGEPPFAGTPLAQKLMKHQQAEAAPLSKHRRDVPKGLQPILDKMLAKEPARRYQTPGEAAADLAAVLEVLPPANLKIADTEATAISPRRNSTLKVAKQDPPPPVPTRRRRGLLLGAVALFVLGGIALLGSQYFPREAMPATEPSRPLTTDAPAAPTTEPMKLLPPTLIIQCGRGKDSVKQNDLLAKGYGYRLTQGEMQDAWKAESLKTHCWYHDREVRFEVTVPPHTAGELRMLFFEPDVSTRKQTLAVQGREIGTYEKFAEGRLVTVPLTAEETRAGKIEVVLKNLVPNNNAVVSTVEFLPAKGRR